MKRVALAALAAVAAACGLLGAPAAPAQAEPLHTIAVFGPDTAKVGEAVVIRAGGETAKPEEWWDLSYLEIVAIPTATIAECPADAQSGAGVAANAGGQILAIAMRPNVSAAGFYDNSVGYTPAAPGTVLICAYIDNENGYTYGSDSWRIEVGGGPGGTPGSGRGDPGGGAANTPLNLSAPRVRRRGSELTCDPGVWTAASGRYRYRWLLDGRRTHVTEPRATIRPAARGHRVSCRVTAYGPGGKATATSRPLRIR